MKLRLCVARPVTGCATLLGGALLALPAAARATVTHQLACQGARQTETAPPGTVQAIVTLNGGRVFFVRQAR